MINLKYLVSGSEITTKTDDENVVITEKKEGSRYIVTVTAKRDIELKSASVSYKNEYDHKARFMMNGYQSWTKTKEFGFGDFLNNTKLLPEKLMEKKHFKSYGSTAFWEMSKDTHLGFDFSYITGVNPMFIGSLNFENAYLLIRFKVNKNIMTLESDIEGKCLQKGESFKVFDYVVIKDGKEYFNRFTPRSDKKLLGFTPWYNHYQNINEQLILDALDKIDPRFELFQIEDGYETYVGDWMDIDSQKFPNGLKGIVEKIHEKGMKAGIWLAPFIAEEESALNKQHPDWIAKDASGEKIYAGNNWSSFMPLDLNNRDAVAYVKEVLKFYKQLGFDFFKLDFLYAVNLCPLKGKTRSETSEFAYALLREELGDSLILGCGATLSNAAGKFDYCRIGPDVSMSFDDVSYLKTSNAERMSTKVSIQNTIFRSRLNGHMFLNDPDVFLLRDENMKLSFEQRKALTKINALFGSVMMTSDNICEYDEDKKAILDDALNIFRNASLIGFKRMKRSIYAEFELDGINRVFVYDPEFGILAEKERNTENTEEIEE